MKVSHNILTSTFWSYPAALLALFFFIKNGEAQDVYVNNSANIPWQHQSIKDIEAKSDQIIVFTNKNRRSVINIGVADKRNHFIYYISQYGYVYDSLSLDEKFFRKIAEDKTPDAFDYYRTVCTNLLEKVTNAQHFLRRNVQNSRQGYNEALALPVVKEASNTMLKMTALDEYRSKIIRILTELDLKVPEDRVSFLFHDSVAAVLKIAEDKSKDTGSLHWMLREVLKNPGKVLVFTYKQPFTAINRAIVYKPASTIYMVTYDNEVTDSFPVKRRQLQGLIKERGDVFFLYRGWLEWQLQNILQQWDEIKADNKRKEANNKGYTKAVFVPENVKQKVINLQQWYLHTVENINLLTLPQGERLQSSYANVPRDRDWMSTLSGWMYHISVYRGYKTYELDDHRGNVMVTVSDKKNAPDTDGDGKIDYYEADVISATDYYSFGTTMPGRNYSSDKYRYGFNGKENDNEVKGKGNEQDYGMRIYDPRLGRFLSVDPISKQYPELTPYQFASNSPIFGIDRDGLELLGNNWLFDIWMDWKFGDPTGIKSLKNGLEQKAAVQMQQMSYHNDKIPESIQTQLDHVNNVEANAKIASGTAKVAAFNVKTSFDIISTLAPIGEGISVTLKSSEIIYNGIKAERVLIGSSEKIAVIGRDFDARVMKFAAGFEKQTKTKIETFRASAGAQFNWEKLLAEYKGNVPDAVAKESLIFKENLSWAEKVKKEGYKVLDTGLGTKDTNGTFYVRKELQYQFQLIEV